MTQSLDHELLVVGAGIAGLGAGIELKRHGFHDFAILERAGTLGGTWRDHTYPGLTVDIPSLTYSFSFEQKPDWSSIWAPQPEVLAYLQGCARKYDLSDHLRYGADVTAARYDELRRLWSVELADGTTMTCRFLINASGFLSFPKLPDIEGMTSFEGEVVHTAAWEQARPVDGKRVAFIGTGATGIQLAPQLAGKARKLLVFQRTPIWLLPKPSLRLPRWLQRAFAAVPGLQRAARLLTSAFHELVFFRAFTKYPQVRGVGCVAERIGRAQIRRTVKDPALHEQLTPDYSWGCKRMSFSNTFYPIFNRDDVELVTSPISHLARDAIVTADGQERPVDTVVCATGYRPFERGTLPTYPVHGRDGEQLDDWWETNHYQAFRGFAVHRFPNFFLVFGPYSIPSTSYFAMVENTMRNITNCLDAARRRGATEIEVTEQAQAADYAETLRRKATSIWRTGNCATSNSYYIDRFGDTPEFRPNFHYNEWWLSHRLSMRHFTIRPPAPEQINAAGPRGDDPHGATRANA